jgi:RNA polymerase sigma-70 factor (ECF subfamily)
MTGARESPFNAGEEAQSRLGRLLADGLAGDASGYRRFLGELAGYLRGYVRKRLGRSADDAEDIVQETLLAVHVQRHTYDPARPFGPWMHAIARYKLVDAWRRREARLAEVPMPEDGENLFGASDDAEGTAKRDILKLLERLPERQRLPIVHTKLEGLSVAETARLTGMSESAVKVGVHRGLKVLACLVR